MGIDRSRLFKRWGYRRSARPSGEKTPKETARTAEQLPEAPRAPSHKEYPSEIEYGNQVNGYDQFCGRGYGDAGYGYGSATSFGPSGGSTAEAGPDDRKV